jgi:hypothetical protein
VAGAAARLGGLAAGAVLAGAASGPDRCRRGAGAAVVVGALAGSPDETQARPDELTAAAETTTASPTASPSPTPSPTAVPTTTRPAPKTPAPRTAPPAPYYANCTAVRAAGKAPLRRGQPGYRSGLDGDSDGVACEVATSRPTTAAPPPPGGGDVYYANCSAARAAGAAPLYRGEPGYRAALDRDDDGIACE